MTHHFPHSFTGKKKPTPGEVIFTPNAAAAAAASSSSSAAAAAAAAAPPPASAAAAPAASSSQHQQQQEAAAAEEVTATTTTTAQLPPHFVPILPPEDTPAFVERPNSFLLHPGSGLEPAQARVFAQTTRAEEAAAYLRRGTLASKGRTKVGELNTYLRECQSSARFALVPLLLCEADRGSALTPPGNAAAYQALMAWLTAGERALYFLLPPPPFPFPVPPGEEQAAGRETLQLYLVPPGLLSRVGAYIKADDGRGLRYAGCKMHAATHTHLRLTTRM